MLPDDDQHPSKVSEGPFSIAVALDVSVQLYCPPRGVVLRACGVERAGVPKAAANVDSDLGRAEDDVDLTPRTGHHPAMESISEATLVELMSQSALRLSAALALSLHRPTLGLRRRFQPRFRHLGKNRMMPGLSYTDDALRAVRASLVDRRDAASLFGDAIRQSFDEVLDGQRTGRFLLEDLSKTEKTYVGTKIEILFGEALGVERGNKLDYLIEGHEVDCKFSLNPGGWMIPIEAQDELCMLVSASDSSARFSIGLLRCRSEILRAPNRDGKRGVLAAARAEIDWVFADEPMPENLLRNLPRETIDAVFGIAGKRKGQARINEFFRCVHRRIVRREVTLTVAQQADGMKRARDARAHLQPEGIIILGHQNAHPRIARELGLLVPRKGELIATRVVRAVGDRIGADKPTVDIGGVVWQEADESEPMSPGPLGY